LDLPLARHCFLLSPCRAAMVSPCTLVASAHGVTPPVVQGVRKTLRARGAYQANAVPTTARLASAWGIRNGKAIADPWIAPRKFRVKRRDQIWTATHRTGFKAKRSRRACRA
jgi:hypothetical protein